MVRVSLWLGIIAAIAGLMAVGFGIPIQAFGLGNTLILAGSTVFSAGLIVITLSMVLRAIDQLSQGVSRPAALEPGGSHASFEHQTIAKPLARPVAPPQAPEWPPAPAAPPRDDSDYAERVEPRRAPMPRAGWQDDGADEPAEPPSMRTPSTPPARPEREPVPPPRLEREPPLRSRPPARPSRLPREPVVERPQHAPEAERRREPAIETGPSDDRSQEPRVDPYAPPERRRVFGWTRRSKERREDDTAAGDDRVEIAPPFGAPSGTAAAARAHPGAVESRDAGRVPMRGPAAPEPREQPAPRRAPEDRNEQMQPVEVLKQGTVDGMSYTLYTDGSIDAEFPEGRIRFDSIEDLRHHLESQG